jgi:hypothetical protein
LISIGLVGIWALAGGKYGRKAQFAFTMGAILLLAGFLTEQWDTASEIVSTVYLRHEAVSESFAGGFTHRIWYTYAHPLGALTMAPFGTGLGSQQVASSLSEENARLGFQVFEGAWGRMTLELGIMGVVGFVGTIAAVFFPLGKMYRAMPAGDEKTVLAVTLGMLLARAFHGFQYNHVAAYFFWSMAATALAMCNRSGQSPVHPPTTRRRPIVQRQHRQAQFASTAAE